MKTFRKHLKDTLSLAYPVAIGQLGYVMMGVVDSAMVGHIGAVPLAAVSLGSGLFFIILVFGLGISYAITPLVAISVGAKNFEKTERIFHQGFIVNFITGVILTVITYFAADLIYYMNQPHDVARQAVSYTKILAFSVLPICLYQSFKQFIEGFSVMRPAMFIAVSANLINLFANWVFIFGNLGAPALNIEGAAIATLFSRVYMLFTMVLFVYNSKFKDYNLSVYPVRPAKELIREILRIGVPSGMQYFFEVFAFVMAAFMVGWLGAQALAAHQIAINVASITYMIVIGLSVAGAVRVGNAVGEKSIPEIRKAGFTAIGSGAVFMLLCGLLIVIFREEVSALYISEPGVIIISVKLLTIAALFQIFDGTQAVGLGVLRGLTDVKFPTIITFTAYWVIGLPAAYFLGFSLNFGVEGIWYGLLLGLAASASMLTLRFNIKSRQPVKVSE
ncbi:MAG: MATE family efflux transporter [Ignavibacteriaceae bacterium]|nr:MATE family efflux transporter [Ignavibacteriaceae bacterium]NUM72025.1 MATE family efflux transporter [Ignavibacteriaceae bacterium]